ncbi:putative molybdenum carrier protein [Thermodesulfobacteriota bacterium]
MQKSRNTVYLSIFKNINNTINIMNIKKIISGGQTGADQAALDAAIEMGIPHGGWVPLGRMTEKGRLSPRYKMQEINAIDYDQRTELNIVDSDGTLLFGKGTLKGGSALTKKLSKKHLKPCLHVDMEEVSPYRAVEIIKSWLDVRKIEVLNVAGPRESECPGIYDHVLDILKSVLYPPPEKIVVKYPQSTAEAVDRLISIMTMKEKVELSRMEETGLLYPSKKLVQYIYDKFGLKNGNEALLQSCRVIMENINMTTEDVPSVIIRELWLKLRETHRLRIVK